MDGGQTNFSKADEALGLSEQEGNLYKRHLENLYGTGGVDNPDGSRSSLYQAVQEHNGKFYNIPTVWNGKREVEPYTKSDGTVMDVPNKTALDNVEREGYDKFPSYSDPDEADARYDQMHGFMEKDTQDYLHRARGGKVNHNPTDAQKASGNYSKRHLRTDGLDISIENEKGSTRSGVGKDGKAWKVKLPYAYGDIKRSTGADGDNVDVILGPHLASKKVFVVDQHDTESGKFDEHKVGIGWGNLAQFRNAYINGFSDGKGKDRMRHIREMDISQFKNWLREGDTTKPIAKAS